MYSLILAQLVFTAIVGYIAMNSPAFKSTFVNTPVIIIVSALLLAISLCIGCCTDFFRRFALPIFIAFTLLEALLVGIVVSGYQSSVVLVAVLITVGLVLALTLYACIR